MGKSDAFIKDRADPFVMRDENGFYYFTASYPMYGESDSEGYDRIILRRSETVEGLRSAEEKVIWYEKNSESAFRFIWAPEIHEIGGKWYVFFAASASESNVWDIDCHILACSGSDPYNDKWVDMGKMRASEGDDFSFRGFSLDMTYFECNGNSYVLWAQNGGNSNVYLASVDKAAPWQLTSQPLLLTSPELPWRGLRL